MATKTSRKNNATVVTRPVYKLGRVIFSIKNCDQNFENELQRLLPLYAPTSDEQVQLISTGCSTDVRAVFNHILKKHIKCVWFNASCLLTSAGRKVLIAGPPHSGKSTLAMGLALGYNWKVVSEDLVLIDFEMNEVLNFPLPFLVRPYTMQLIDDAVGARVKVPDFDEGWHPIGDMAAKFNCSSDFDHIFILGNWHPRLKFETLDAGSCLRKLLPLSNILKRPNSVEKLTKIFSNANCFLLTGGSVGARADYILDVCK